MKKGLDAPLVPIFLFGAGVCGVFWVIISKDWGSLIFPVFLLAFGGLYLRTSLVGKYRILERIAAQLKLTDQTKVLDLGTGHGAFLLTIAKNLTPPAKAIGIDIWNEADQLHNSLAQTTANIEQAGLTDVCEVKTADMTKLPFSDQSFDYVVSSLALHNLKPQVKREQALSEAYRVLRSEGTLILVDIEHVSQYRWYLMDLGAQTVTVKHAGFDGMYGALATRVLVAKK